MKACRRIFTLYARFLCVLSCIPESYASALFLGPSCALPEHSLRLRFRTRSSPMLIFSHGREYRVPTLNMGTCISGWRNRYGYPNGAEKWASTMSFPQKAARENVVHRLLSPQRQSSSRFFVPLISLLASFTKSNHALCVFPCCSDSPDCHWSIPAFGIERSERSR